MKKCYLLILKNVLLYNNIKIINKFIKESAKQMNLISLFTQTLIKYKYENKLNHIKF